MTVKVGVSQKIINIKKELWMDIYSVDAVNANEWSGFLDHSSESTFYCTLDWWKTFDRSYVLQLRNKKDELIGGVPFRLLSVIPLIGRYFEFAWLDSSVLVSDEYCYDHKFAIKKAALKYLSRYLKSLNVIIVTVSTKAQSHDEDLFKELWNASEKCATLLVDLKRTEDEILAGYEKRKRNSIRKALKKGVEVKIKEGKEGYDLIADYSYLQDKLFNYKKDDYSEIYAKSESHVRHILSSQQNAIIAIAYFKGQPAAANILVSHRDTVYAYLGASDIYLNRATNASTLLEHECMLYVRRLDYSYYDLGGIPSQVPDKTDPLYGIYLYKKGFGGEVKKFDCASYPLKRYRYRMVWWLRKFENNIVARKCYKILKRLGDKSNLNLL